MWKREERDDGATTSDRCNEMVGSDGWMLEGGGGLYTLRLRGRAAALSGRQLKGSVGKGREAERRQAKTRKSAKARAKRQGKGQPSERVE